MYASVKSDDVDVPDDWEDLEDLTDEEREALEDKAVAGATQRPHSGRAGD